MADDERTRQGVIRRAALAHPQVVAVARRQAPPSLARDVNATLDGSTPTAAALDFIEAVFLRAGVNLAQFGGEVKDPARTLTDAAVALASAPLEVSREVSREVGATVRSVAGEVGTTVRSGVKEGLSTVGKGLAVVPGVVVSYATATTALGVTGAVVAYKSGLLGVVARGIGKLVGVMP